MDELFAGSPVFAKLTSTARILRGFWIKRIQAARVMRVTDLDACSRIFCCPLYAQIAIFVQFFGSVLTLEKICDIKEMALTLFNLLSAIDLINLSTYAASTA